MRISTPKVYILAYVGILFIMVFFADQITFEFGDSIIAVLVFIWAALYFLFGGLETLKQIHLTPKGVSCKILCFKWFRPWTYYKTIYYHNFGANIMHGTIRSAIFFVKQPHKHFVPSRWFHCKYFHPFTSFYITFPRDGASAPPGRKILVGNRTLTIDKLTEWGVEIENVEEAKKRVY